MSEFKYVSNKKKDKIKLFPDDNYSFAKNFHGEFSGNEWCSIEGCTGVVEYSDNYIKIRLKKGYLSFMGNCLKITYFENLSIAIKGYISNIEFCV